MMLDMMVLISSHSGHNTSMAAALAAEPIVISPAERFYLGLSL